MFISKRVQIEKNFLNIIFCMDSQEIYLKIVAPIKIGKGGYSVVKDKNLAIIMHHYAWDDSNLTPLQRLAALYLFNIHNEEWTVNSTLPIEEISSPLIQIALIILLVSSICFIAIIIIAGALTRVIAGEEAN